MQHDHDGMVIVAGEEKAWAGVPKFHDLRHMIAPIARWGCIEITSGNSGELAHKSLLKLAAQCNNRKQIALGIAKHNARRAALLMMDAKARHLIGREDDDIEDLDSEFLISCVMRKRKHIRVVLLLSSHFWNRRTIGQLRVCE